MLLLYDNAKINESKIIPHTRLKWHACPWQCKARINTSSTIKHLPCQLLFIHFTIQLKTFDKHIGWKNCTKNFQCLSYNVVHHNMYQRHRGCDANKPCITWDRHPLSSKVCFRRNRWLLTPCTWQVVRQTRRQDIKRAGREEGEHELSDKGMGIGFPLHWQNSRFIFYFLYFSLVWSFFFFLISKNNIFIKVPEVLKKIT